MKSGRKIGVLIVDDSALMRSILIQILGKDPDFVISGEASNGAAGCEANLQLKPDVIMMDINMPVMNGIEAAAKIMKERPVPIIIFSGEIDASSGFEAVAAGAVDVMQKPDIGMLASPDFLKELKLRIMAALGSSGPEYKGPGAGNSDPRAARNPGIPQIIVVGASTGGPAAVRTLLSDLPGDLGAGVALVQHLEEGFDAGYAAWLDEATALKVRLAAERNVISPGEVIVARVDSHLAVRRGQLVLEDGPKVQNQRPAADVLFTTAAEYFGSRVLGILLTGMGRDGADGCSSIVAAGGYTIVQDQASSAIFGMPKAAIDAGAASEVAGLPEIALRIRQITEAVKNK